MDLEPSTPQENPQDEMPPIDRRSLRKAILTAIGAIVLIGGVFMTLRQQFETREETTYHAMADAMSRVTAFKVPQPPPAKSFTQYIPDGDRSYRKIEATIKDFRGQPVLLVLWASWCQPCRPELQALDKMLPDLTRAGLAVLPVMTADKSGIAGARFFFRGADIVNLPYFLDHGTELMEALTVRELPSILFIDSEGRAFAFAVGLDLTQPLAQDMLFHFARTERLPD